MSTDYTITPARFALKKLGRRAMISAGRILYAVSSERPRVRVLTYHRFGNVSWDPCCIEGSTFQSHLSRLSTSEIVITPGEFAMLMTAPEDLQHRRILLTIDDGHISVQSHALPRLDDLGIKAILFVCPGLVESQSSSMAASARQFMGWDDLALARENGHEIAPHSLYHDSLARMPLSAALDDIDRSTDLLERRLGVRTRFFSFPFGTRRDFSEALLCELNKRGYSFCFSAIHGSCKPTPGPVCYPRLKIEGGGEGDLFPHIVRGCLDHWSLFDNHFHALQHRGRL